MNLDVLFEFINKYDYIVLPVAFGMILIAVFFLFRMAYRSYVNALFLRIWISPTSYIKRKVSILDKKYRLKLDETDGTYILDHRAMNHELGKFRIYRYLDFMKGIEFPFIRVFESGSYLMKFIGTETLTSMLEHKAFIEVASMRDGNKFDMKYIIMIIGAVVIVALGFYAYQSGFFKK